MTEETKLNDVNVPSASILIVQTMATKKSVQVCDALQNLETKQRIGRCDQELENTHIKRQYLNRPRAEHLLRIEVRAQYSVKLNKPLQTLFCDTAELGGPRTPGLVPETTLQG